MTAGVSLEERLRGCLVGAAIGAELGFARCVEPERFKPVSPEKSFEVKLTPVKTYRPDPHRMDVAATTPLVALGVRAYLAARGRVTPEDFGRLFSVDEGVATPAFRWDGLHTVQEMLREGMNPRLSGLGTFPSGLICAAMPAVGAYHFACPEYAYLDGVELASVAQGELGADWAALCAAAIAAAFQPDVTGRDVVDTVMKIAFANNKSLYYDLDWAMRNAGHADETEFLRYWHQRGGAPDYHKDTLWLVYNPISFVLPVLARYAAEPRKMMSLLVASPSFMFTQSVSPVIAGAIAGAMHGTKAFPKEWRKWGEPLAEPWFGLEDVVRRRVRAEARVITVTERLAKPDADGNSALRDKVRGCILAGAIGNAMGSPVEGRFYTEIDAKYPDGITTVLDPSRLEGEDDNQAAMLLTETYVTREGLPVSARHLGKTWRERLNRDRFYPYCMGHAYDLLRKGWDPRVIGQWAVVTGSTVMCMEPVGTYHLADPEFAAIDARAIACMYQRGLDVTCAEMLAATVAEAFRPQATVESVCEAALKAAPKTKLITFDRRAFRSCRHYIETCLEIADRYDDVLAARRELHEKCLLYHQIDPLELWGLALAMFKIAKGDVRQSAIGGTNIGRDSDTIAGRAAMLSGTLRGVGNVPAEWIDLFSAATLERIYANADRVVDLIVNRKLPMLRRRQDV